MLSKPTGSASGAAMIDAKASKQKLKPTRESHRGSGSAVVQTNVSAQTPVIPTAAKAKAEAIGPISGLPAMTA
jgi:hypothetical protein